MEGNPAFLLIVLCSVATLTTATKCSTTFSNSTFFKDFTFTASSESVKNSASEVFSVGWCALNKPSNPHIDIDFKNPYGIRSITVSIPTNREVDLYATNVLVQYVPNGGNQIVSFPVPGGKLEINLTQPGSAQNNFNQAIAASKLRFTIQDFKTDACLKIELTGCTINELCAGGCEQNGGVCVYEDHCQCPQGALGDNCELRECKPEKLGLSDGRIGSDHVTVSSQDVTHTKEQIGNDAKFKGWCPLTTDTSPWVEVRLDKHEAVSIFEFSWSDLGGQTILTEFELQYVAAIDSTRRFRTFAPEIPAMNSTHVFTVSTQPAMVTNAIRIIPSKWNTRACFKLEIHGCDPTALCADNWCQNGGTCMGENVCLCPKGYLGNRCEQSTNEIAVTNMTFVKIEHNVVVTTSTTIQFQVTGNVKLEVVAAKPVLTINGSNSFITLNQTTGTPSCLTNVNLCTNGFTFTVDINFGMLLDNTFIVSSGGHLPDHSGISLYYNNNLLHYIVSTSTQTWTVVVQYIPVLHQWQHFELTWNKHLGIEILVNGHSLGTNSRPSNTATTSKLVDLCIGCSHTTSINVNINMQITGVNSWTIDRTELVNAGVKDPPATSTVKTTTIPATTAAPATTQAPTPECTPENLGLSDGRIGADHVTVSSQDVTYNKEEIGNDAKFKGWCPLTTDTSPWVEVRLDKPEAVSIFEFMWSDLGGQTILTEFELQYVAAIDSTKRFRTFAPDIPAMNSTHVFTVTTQPAIVTDAIRIIPSKWTTRPCFKLEIQGCDPTALCADNWCQNGGTCMGENVCICPKGYLGNRCEQSTNEIAVTNMTFVKIEHNVVVTTSTTIQFQVTGNVKLEIVAEKPVLTINGSNSFITLNQTTGTPSCLTNVNLCTNGFTFTVDINFGMLLNNTFIVSSGGHLPDHSGISLYYNNNLLHYIVSTSTQTWIVVVHYTPVLHQWQHFELTWNKHLGIEILVNGHSLGTNSRPSNTATTSKLVDLCIGCSHTTSINVNINMQITGVNSWTIDRTELVNAGVKDPPVAATTPMPSTTSTPTTTTAPPAISSELPQAYASSTELQLSTNSFSTDSQMTVTIKSQETSEIAMDTTTDTSVSTTEPPTSFSTIDSLILAPKGSTGTPLKPGKMTTEIAPTTSDFTISSDIISSTTSLQQRKSTKNIQPTITSGKISKVTYSSKTKPTIDLTSTTWNVNNPSTTTETNLGATASLGKSVENGTTTIKQLSTGLDTTSKVTPTNNSASVTPSQPPFLQYNLTFLSIINNILITPTFNFTLHNKPTLELQNSSHTAIVLDCSKQQYVELPDKGTPCLEDITNCKNGFTFKIEVLFTKLETANKTYILSSGGDISGTSGMAIYVHSNQLIFGVKQGFQHWSGRYDLTGKIKENVWYKIELSWNQTKGILVLIDGYEVINANKWTPSAIAPKTHPVLIGKTEGSSETSCIKVRDLFTWTTQREVLVDHGIVAAPVKTTALPTSSTTTTTTTTTTPTTTTMATTTQLPVPTFTWNLTSITNNIIIGNHYNLTVHGTPVVISGGIQINSTTNYIEFGKHTDNCLIKPGPCQHGLTIRFTIQFNTYSENTHFFTSGGQLPDGVGIAIVYRFGKIQFILTTTTQSWYINCKKNQLPPNKYHTIMLSWHLNTGLEVFINNILIDATKVPDPHQAVLANATNVYIGKQPSTSVKVDFVLQTIHIWYAYIEILVEQGKCEPPVRPTTAPTAQTTKPASPQTTKPSATPSKNTLTTIFTPTSAPQCPAGCVSISTSGSQSPTKQPVTTAKPSQTTAKPPATATTKQPSTPKPTTKQPSTTFAPPTPDTATPPPPTTRNPIPDFNQYPTINVTVQKDKNAYIACTFRPTHQKDVQIEASLLVNGKVRLVLIVGGNTGVAMFPVSQVDMVLYNKEIKCSVKAYYFGSTVTTGVFGSNIFVPVIKVTPTRVIVTEGHSTEFVTVISTAPPQFFCCSGCKAECQVHIVGTFHYERYFQKCNNNYIAQAVIESTKPPNFNEHICGYALTLQNWNQVNKIHIKATIDGRRDRDHTNNLDIIVNVYNQPSTVQITVKPVLITVTTIQVTVKDNDHSPAQCKSVNDPHMQTFDGQRYNNMKEGEFVLFRHTTLPFEVRAIYYKCSKRSHATCNCAVAVKSGDDVITVTGCQGTVGGGHPGQGHGIGLLLQQMFGTHGHAHGHGHKDELAKTPMTIQIYKNGELTPGTYIRRIGCGQKYEILLPTGMVVTVQQSWKPFINIWIQASSTDRGHAEGLCGNFDGSKSNDLKPNTNAVINKWQVTNTNFFYGVGVSSHTYTNTYCSCIKDKNKICLAGLGAFRCVATRYDVTATLVQHAKRPVLTRHKRQANTEPVPIPTDIPTDVFDLTYDEAEKQCEAKIMNSAVTTSCKPILTANLTDQIENCAHDYNATGNFEWASDALRDIVVDCVEAANAIRVANETGNTNVTDEFPDLDPENIEKVLENLDVCLEDCGAFGNCTDGVCVCDDGYSGINCNISKDTKPTVISTTSLCDTTDESDCSAAAVYGDNFVESESLTCHYEYAEVSDGISLTGETGQVRGVYISLNHVTCPLPKKQSARVSISNDGQTLSDNSTVHVVYNEICFDCTDIPTCSRKENNCVINGVCYEKEATRPGDICQICRPVANSSEWTRNTIAECIPGPSAASVKTDDSEKTKVLVLAIVCGILAAIVLIGAIYCIRAKAGQKSAKEEFGEYDIHNAEKLHREPIGMTNHGYDVKL